MRISKNFLDSSADFYSSKFVRAFNPSIAFDLHEIVSAVEFTFSTVSGDGGT